MRGFSLIQLSNIHFLAKNTSLSNFNLLFFNFLLQVCACVLGLFLKKNFMCAFFLLPERHVLIISIHVAPPPPPPSPTRPTSAHLDRPRSAAVCSLCAGYSPAWEVCSLLGQCEGYAELEARQELLAFSLTHCPPVSIHGLLAASSHLQTQVSLRRFFFLCLSFFKKKNPKQNTDTDNKCDVLASLSATSACKCY